MSKSDYAPPKGEQQCPPHRLGLTRSMKSHLWTDAAGENWTCQPPDPGAEVEGEEG